MADVIGGLLIIFSSISLFNFAAFYFGVVILVKGVWTVFDSLRKRFYVDILGWIDVVAGFALLLVFFDKSISLLWVFGLLLLGKGLWSILNSM